MSAFTKAGKVAYNLGMKSWQMYGTGQSLGNLVPVGGGAFGGPKGLGISGQGAGKPWTGGPTLDFVKGPDGTFGMPGVNTAGAWQAAIGMAGRMFPHLSDELQLLSALIDYFAGKGDPYADDLLQMYNTVQAPPGYALVRVCDPTPCTNNTLACGYVLRGVATPSLPGCGCNTNYGGGPSTNPGGCNKDNPAGRTYYHFVARRSGAFLVGQSIYTWARIDPAAPNPFTDPNWGNNGSPTGPPPTQHRNPAPRRPPILGSGAIAHWNPQALSPLSPAPAPVPIPVGIVHRRPVPSPVPNPIPGIVTGPRPRTGPRPTIPPPIVWPPAPPNAPPRPHANRPPGRNTREHKAMVVVGGGGALGKAWKAINSITEAFDAIEAVHDALPEGCQTKSKSPAKMLQALYSCKDTGNNFVNDAINNLIEEGLKDLINARAGRAGQAGGAAIGSPVGLGFGPAIR